ncbi:phage head closure protein [Anaerocolumna jejuensis]|uniref:phage head closure protein n=1 Tax=Anaerocolumna jejuensis TaxID=259063 RepID=UPI003F7B94A9
MVINRLNKRITFMQLSDKDENGVPFENEIGNNIQKLIPFKTVWASVEPISGKEYLEAQRAKNELTHRIYTRYFPDITVDMLINFKGRKFKIESVINYQEGNEMLQFLCREMVGDKFE